MRLMIDAFRILGMMPERVPIMHACALDTRNGGRLRAVTIHLITCEDVDTTIAISLRSRI